MSGLRGFWRVFGSLEDLPQRRFIANAGGAPEAIVCGGPFFRGLNHPILLVEGVFLKQTEELIGDEGAVPGMKEQRIDRALPPFHMSDRCSKIFVFLAEKAARPFSRRGAPRKIQKGSQNEKSAQCMPSWTETSVPVRRFSFDHAWLLNKVKTFLLRLDSSREDRRRVRRVSSMAVPWPIGSPPGGPPRWAIMRDIVFIQGTPP